MEVVIAIGVIAFVIPLFLALSKSAGESRLNAEADTRAAWIAREVQREILAAWADPPQTSLFGASLNFPDFGNDSAPEILAFDFEGSFLTKGGLQDLSGRSAIPRASYLVAVHAEEYPTSASPSDHLSLIHIRVLHPAQATAEGRRAYHYKLISTRNGIH